METIKDFISRNSEALESYSVMEDDEKSAFEKKFIQVAAANKPELAAYLKEAECYDDLLELIYDALANEPAWEGFFLTEMENMIRLYIQDPEKDSDGPDNYSKIESMGLSKLSDGPFGKSLTKLIIKQVDHSDPYISRRFLAMLVDYWLITGNNQEAVEKLKSKLSDENWQVRWLAYEGLSFSTLKIDKSDVHIPFGDKFKGFFPSFFGDPRRKKR
ncbi:MAG: HEAT repeat domain-containing protein [Cytophagaceae bacterium]